MFIPQFKLRLKGYLEMWENLCNFISKVLMCILYFFKWSTKMFVDKTFFPLYSVVAGGHFFVLLDVLNKMYDKYLDN